VAAHCRAVVRPGRCVDRPLLLSPHLLVPIQVLVLDRSFVISFICLHSSSRSPLYCRVLTLFNGFLPRADTFVLTPFNGFLPRADTFALTPFNGFLPTVTFLLGPPLMASCPGLTHSS